MDKLQKFRHLYARAGYGLSLSQFSNPKEIKVAVDDLFPTAMPGDLEIIDEQEWKSNNPASMKSIMDEEERKQKKKDFNKRRNDLNLLWVQAMVNTNYPLMEKMAMFWHGHFGTHIDNPYYDQQLLNIFRKKGLGNFSDLLSAVSKSPAMLQYLNNKQNKKMHPNENFAREVMELFTLGRGHYTEEDIMEAARAFTGWSFDDNGNFEFKEKQHDYGNKMFLGKQGNFNGDDILNILLEQKQTAIFITSKVYRFFVSDEKINEKHVQVLAKNFYNSNYSIPVLLKEIFTADWFYADEFIGSKIKSPIELLVGYRRTIPVLFNKDQSIIHIQKVLGQYLFNPPNVAGWKGGKSWIDSSSLVVRMRLPEALYGTGELNISVKETIPETGDNHIANNHPDQPFKIGKVQADWSDYLAYWKGKSKAELTNLIASYLLMVPVSDQILNVVATFADNKNDENLIKSLTIRLMELPEFQLT